MRDKYTLVNNPDRYEILTPSGYRNFSGLRKLHSDFTISLSLSNGKTIRCTPDHPLLSHGQIKLTKEIKIGDSLESSTDDVVFVTDIKKGNLSSVVYDIVGVENGSLFYVDGIVSHNCDFLSSGDTVVDPEILSFYRDSFIKDPVERGGFDGNLWRWEYPNYSRSYMISADVSRGDGTDYSTAQIFDVESATQVAEYQGKLDTRDFGNLLVSLATEYNEALLVIENSNIGWATIQQVINRNYPNLFYMSKDLKYVDTENHVTNKYYSEERSMVAGFSTTSRTRPLIISKIDEYMREKTVIIRSIRLLDELYTFNWIGGKAQAMRGYNDDLVMALGICLWVRDTALRLRQEGIDLTRQALNGITVNNHSGVYGANNNSDDPWVLRLGDHEERLLDWL